MVTYRQSIGPSQLLLQTIGIGLGGTGLVGVVHADNTADAKESDNEASEVEEALAGGDVSVLLGTEHTEDFVVLVHRFTEVALLLGVPPATVGISEGSLHTGRVRVVVVLSRC
jgi:hypothetical protein